MREEQFFYPHDTVRLVREIPETSLGKEAEGTVVNVMRGADGRISSVEVRFYGQPSGASVVSLPPDALEPVISRSSQDRTAVLWGGSSPPEQLIETAMHAVLDRGFLMREGLNVVRLYHDKAERWWKWGDRISDPAGAQIVVSGPDWDGGIVAFSGPQRLQLEFRLTARGGACVLLHECDDAYRSQCQDSTLAMALARMLMNLSDAVGAPFCAFPVADPWLMDEDWGSLLHAPYYPDFFIVPDVAHAPDYPHSFRMARLTGNRVMLTALPVKFSPDEESAIRTDRDLKMDSLRKCHALGEKYYDQMYETRFGINGLYSNVKDAFLDAISLANELDMKEEADKLEDRLEHIKAVFRSQFS